MYLLITTAVLLLSTAAPQPATLPAPNEICIGCDLKLVAWNNAWMGQGSATTVPGMAISFEVGPQSSPGQCAGAPQNCVQSFPCLYGKGKIVFDMDPDEGITVNGMTVYSGPTGTTFSIKVETSNPPGPGQPEEIACGTPTPVSLLDIYVWGLSEPNFTLGLQCTSCVTCTGEA